MKCPVCKINKATYDEYYGWLPCDECRKKQSQQVKPSGNLPEFTSESIKKQRKEYAADILQPHNRGELSKEWVDVHGKKKAKERGFSDKEIKNAKNVWTELNYYKN